jgi:exosortase/archaeosortase family protein
VQITSMPAVIEGNSIFIPFGQIVIADGCSGLRYFEIALALAYIIGLLNNYDERKLLPALLIAATLGLLANWLRIFILVIIGYATKMQSPLMANHEYFGWALFGAMCLPTIYWAPVIVSKPSLEAPNTSSQKLYKYIFPLCALGLGPLLNLFISESPVTTEFKKILSQNIVPISESRMPLSVRAPSKSFKELGQAEISTERFYVEIDQYQRSLATDKLVPYIDKLYNSDEWMILAAHTIEVDSHKAALTIFRRKASDFTLVQLQWFEIGNYKTNSVAKAKLLQIPALLGGANNFKIVTLQAPCENADCTQEGALLLKHAAGIFAASTHQ